MKETEVILENLMIGMIGIIETIKIAGMSETLETGMLRLVTGQTMKIIS